MKKFQIGDVVRILAHSMKGVVGTVVFFDEKRSQYLVRIDAVNQNYFGGDELELFSAK